MIKECLLFGLAIVSLTAAQDICSACESNNYDDYDLFEIFGQWICYLACDDGDDYTDETDETDENEVASTSPKPSESTTTQGPQTTTAKSKDLPKDTPSNDKESTTAQGTQTTGKPEEKDEVNKDDKGAAVQPAEEKKSEGEDASAKDKESTVPKDTTADKPEAKDEEKKDEKKDEKKTN